MGIICGLILTSRKGRIGPENGSEILPCELGLRQHLSASAGLCVAATGTARLSYCTLSPLLLVPYHPHHISFLCIPSSSLHVSCQLCLARVSSLGSSYHTSTTSCLSASSLSFAVLSPPLSSSSLLLPLTYPWLFCVPCPSQTLPTMPSTTCHLIVIRRCLSPSQTIKV